jgi:GH25 family lysozyme M1 (1,4-beta-N-acetylmuramidase)
MTRAHGVDLSRWDVSFDPAKATGVIDFAIMKACEGTFRDSKFAEIWAGVQKVPIRGAYHYLRSGMSWQTQADFFLSVVNGFDFHLYALDFEATGNTMGAPLASAAHSWIEYVASKTGKMVILYTNSSHYDADLFPYGDWMKDHPLWVAQYWKDPTPDKDPNLPKKRKPGDWSIYQYASEINFPGHAKEYGTPVNSIDLNVFNGTVADMRAWLKLSELPPTPPPVPVPPTPTPQPVPTPVDEKAVQLETIEWMIAQLIARKNELNGGGPVG